MQSTNVEELLRQTEGKLLEFKRDLSSKQNVLASVVAFANTAGGVLVIGVEDQSHNVCGIDEPLLTEEKLANLISDGVTPRLIPDIEIVPWRRTHLLTAEIYRGSNPPDYVNRLGPEAGVFVRVGSTNRRAGAGLTEELRSLGRNEPFDERPVVDLNSEELDFRVASELFKPIRSLRRC